MKQFVAAILLSLAVFTTACAAMEATVAAAEAQLNQRVLAISSELRCFVCQNEPLADSNAGLAQDLRREIRDQIQAGKSDREVVDFMADRYSDLVQHQPAWLYSGFLFRFGLTLLVAVGIGALTLLARRRSKFRQMADRDEYVIENQSDG